MKLTQKLSLLILGFMIQNMAIGHEGLHAAGQMHAGENHMGLFEVALAVISIVFVAGYLLKNHKSKK